MNKIMLLGRLTNSPEILTTQKEKMIGKITLAVPRKYVKDGEERKVDFINIVAFSKLAECVSKFLQKGQQVLITGRLEINQYEDENGERKYITQVIAEEIDFVGNKKDNNENEESNLDWLYENDRKEVKIEEQSSSEDEITSLF